MHKKIGILGGMSPESTIEYYQYITRAYTERFGDYGYPFAFETIRRVEAAGFELYQRFGNLWVYTLNFRRDASPWYPGGREQEGPE